MPFLNHMRGLAKRARAGVAPGDTEAVVCVLRPLKFKPLNVHSAGQQLGRRWKLFGRHEITLPGLQPGSGQEWARLIFWLHEATKARSGHAGHAVEATMYCGFHLVWRGALGGPPMTNATI